MSTRQWTSTNPSFYSPKSKRISPQRGSPSRIRPLRPNWLLEGISLSPVCKVKVNTFSIDAILWRADTEKDVIGLGRTLMINYKLSNTVLASKLTTCPLITYNPDWVGSMIPLEVLILSLLDLYLFHPSLTSIKTVQLGVEEHDLVFLLSVQMSLEEIKSNYWGITKHNEKGLDLDTNVW